MTRAHEREFGSITESNRPIWMLADAAEAGSHDGSTHEGIPTDNPAFCKFLCLECKFKIFFQLLFVTCLHCIENKVELKPLIF